MTAVVQRPTLLSSCALAATAAEAGFRIDAANTMTRASRIVALDDGAADIVRRVSDLPWRGAHFLTFVAPASGPGREGLGSDATLRTADGAIATLHDELEDADVAVMVATDDHGAEAASIIGQACFMLGIMTAGMVIAEGGTAEQAVSALRPHAKVLVVTTDEDDVPEMLTALRA